MEIYTPCLIVLIDDATDHYRNASSLPCTAFCSDYDPCSVIFRLPGSLIDIKHLYASEAAQGNQFRQLSSGLSYRKVKKMPVESKDGIRKDEGVRYLFRDWLRLATNFWQCYHGKGWMLVKKCLF